MHGTKLARPAGPVLGLVLGGLIGAGSVGAFVALRPPAPDAAAPARLADWQAGIEARLEAARATRSAPPAASADLRLIAGALARLEAKLGELGERACPGSSASPRPQPKAPPADVAQAAAARGRELSTRALAAGRWASADLEEFRHLSGQMESETLRPLIRALLAAHNAQRLQVDEPGPPF